MTNKSRVFVVNEPLKRDPDTGAFGRAINLDPAKEHGELVFMLPPGKLPRDPQAVISDLQAAFELEDFTVNDYLVLVGDLRAIAWASAIAAQRTGGWLSVLQWDGQRRRYDIVRARLWETDAVSPLDFAQDAV